jgi:hypothetical protein
MQEQTYGETANSPWRKGNVKSQRLVPATQVYVNSLTDTTNKEITHVFNDITEIYV